MGACRRPRVPCAGAVVRSRSRSWSGSRWAGSLSVSSSRAAARRRVAPPPPRRRCAGRRRPQALGSPQCPGLARVAPARASPGSARARSRLRADRRPEQRPAPARVALASRRLAVPASRRRAVGAVVPRPGRRVLHARLPADLDERGVQPDDGADLGAPAPDRVVVRAPGVARLRHGISLQPGRRLPAAERPDDGRRHPELPRPLGEPRRTASCARSAIAGACAHDPPYGLSSPNGATPARRRRRARDRDRRLGRPADGGRTARYSVRTPTTYPSDAQLLPNGNILVAGFDSPGRVDEITPSGRIVWTFEPSGYWTLDRPSLAVRWPNGMIAITDDWHHRVLVVDPRTKRVVWSYGHLNRPGPPTATSTSRTGSTCCRRRCVAARATPGRRAAPRGDADRLAAAAGLARRRGRAPGRQGAGARRPRRRHVVRPGAARAARARSGSSGTCRRRRTTPRPRSSGGRCCSPAGARRSPRRARPRRPVDRERRGAAGSLGEPLSDLGAASVAARLPRRRLDRLALRDRGAALRPGDPRRRPPSRRAALRGRGGARRTIYVAGGLSTTGDLAGRVRGRRRLRLGAARGDAAGAGLARAAGRARRQAPARWRGRFRAAGDLVDPRDRSGFRPSPRAGRCRSRSRTRPR